MKVTISKKNNFKHIVGEEWKKVYGMYEEGVTKEEIIRITEEYEGSLNENGHQLTNQDKMNIEATTNLYEGEYDFDCGDFTYYITIKN